MAGGRGGSGTGWTVKTKSKTDFKGKTFLLSLYLVVSKDELHGPGPSVPNEKGSENLGWASDFTQALPHSARTASDEL